MINLKGRLKFCMLSPNQPSGSRKQFAILPDFIHGDCIMTETTECTGTARALHEASEFDMLEFDYSRETAILVTTKAIQKSFPEITETDVEGFVKVNRALQSGKISIAAERQRMEDQAHKAASQLLKNMGDNEVEVIEDLTEE